MSTAIYINVIMYISISFTVETYQKNPNVLNDICHQQLTQAISVLEVSGKRLRDGEISLEQLKKIIEYSNIFIGMIKLVPGETTDVDMETPIATILKDRQAELDAYDAKEKLISRFLNMCHRIPKGKSNYFMIMFLFI